MTTSIELHSNVRKDGRQLIQIKINNGKERKRCSSEIYVKKNQFNKKAKWGKWIISHPESNKMNLELEKKINIVKENFQKTKNIISSLYGENFFDFAYDFIEKYNNQEQQWSYQAYNAKLNKLKNYSSDKLMFNDITVNFIRNYCVHLKKKYNNRVNTIAVDLRKIRSIINQAIKEEIIDYSKNPFLKIKIETERTSKQKLTIEDVETIRLAHFEGWLNDARNIFLFCLNCMGMRIGSALKLKRNQIKNGQLYYQMNKGGKGKNIELTDESKKIVDYYLNSSDGEYLFPYLEGCENEWKKIKSSTSQVNNALRKISNDCGIKIKLTTHVNRHTFTLLAIESGADMRTLQGMLNHTSVSTTEHYAGQISDKNGNDALKKIFKSNSNTGNR